MTPKRWVSLFMMMIGCDDDLLNRVDGAWLADVPPRLGLSGHGDEYLNRVNPAAWPLPTALTIILKGDHGRL